MAEGNNYGERFKTNTFVLVNVPDLEDKFEYMTDYLESTLAEDNVSVCNLSFHPGVPDRVLVMLDESIDLAKAKSAISEQPLEDQKLSVEKAEEMNAVIVNGDDLEGKLTHFFLKLYLQSEFGDSEEVVTNCVRIPQSSDVAVHFTNEEVTRKVLRHQNHRPLPGVGYRIDVKPFFSNFHGRISHGGRHFLHTLEEYQDYLYQIEDPKIQKRSEKDQSKNNHCVEKQPHTLEENQDGLSQSEDPNIQKRSEKDQSKNNHSVEKQLHTMTTSNRDFKWDVDTRPVHEARRDVEPMETDFHSLNYPTYVCDQQGFSLPYTAMGSSETNSGLHSAGKKSLDRRRHSSSDRQADTSLYDTIQSVNALSLKSERDGNAPQMNFGANPGENKEMNKSDEEHGTPLNKALWYLMKEEIRGNGIEVTYDFIQEIVLVKHKNVSLFSQLFKEFKGRVIERHIPLDEKKEMVLNSEYAKKFILSRFHDVPCSIDRQNMSLAIYGLYESSVNIVERMVTKIFDNFVEKSIPNYVSDEDFLWCQQHYEQFHPVRISRDVHHVTVMGKRDSVMQVKDYLERNSKVRSQQEHGRQWKKCSVQFSEIQYDLLMLFHRVEIEDVLKSVKYAWNSGHGQEGKVVIEFEGTLTDVKKAEEKLLEIQRSIQTETIDVSVELGSTKNSLLIQRFSSLSKYDPLYYAQKSFENENKCIIKNDVDTESSYQSSGAVQNHQQKGPMTSNPTDVSIKDQKCVFQVSPFLQLEIKNYGDIVQQQCDVLVCFSPQHKTLMSTYVGIAFSKAIKDFEKKVDSLHFSDNKVAFTGLNFPGSPCLALAFMVLPRTADAQSFCQGVLEVLHRTAEFGAHTICFPPLGHGRTMQYPDNFISENFLCPLKCQVSQWPSTSLERISFLATNQDLYEKMASDASANFKLISKSPKSKGSDETFVVIDEKVEIKIAHRNQQRLAPLWKKRLEEMTGDK